MVTGWAPGGSDAHLEDAVDHFTSGDVEVRGLERNVDTIGQGGLPSSGFVTEEAREALRCSGGFPPVFRKKANLSYTLVMMKT